MTDHPINSVVVDNSDVAKASFRSWAKNNIRLRVASLAEVNSADYSDAVGIDLSGVLYDKDTTDTTTADDDGATTIVDAVGTRFKRVSISVTGKRVQVRGATTANITIATALNNGDSLDGLTLATNDLILVKNQTDPAQNGVYVVGASPARDASFDTFEDYPGAQVVVTSGTANANTLWFCSANEGGTLGTTAIPFTKVAFTGTGDVVGPGSSTTGRVAKFSGTDGKTLADGGILASDLFAKTRQVATSGLATGGGDLSADRTINVSAASDSETIAGSSTSKATTPHGVMEFVRPVLAAQRRLRASTRYWPLIPSASFVADPEFPVLPPFTFARASTKEVTGSNGLLRTVASGAPAHNYDALTRAYKGIRFEVGSTNLALWSADYSNAAYTKTNCTISTNSGADPYGTTLADKIVEDTSTGVHRTHQIVTISPAQYFTFSKWVKAAGRTQVQLRITSQTTANSCSAIFDLSTGKIVSGTVLNTGTGTGAAAFIQNWGNGLYRCVLVGKPDTSGTDARFFTLCANAGSTSYTGDGSSGLYVFGEQYEALGKATSYIPTTSAQVTRSSDTLTLATSATLAPSGAGWFNALEGIVRITFSVDFLLKDGSVETLIAVNDTTTANYMRTAIAATFQPQFASVASSSTQFSDVTTETVVQGKETTVAFRYKANDYGVATNGGIPTTSTSTASVPAVTQLEVGRNAGTAKFAGDLLSFDVFQSSADDVSPGAGITALLSAPDEIATRRQTLVMLGDSITAAYSIPAMVGAELGMKVVNGAFAGTQMGEMVADDRDPCAGYNLATAINTGDWSAVITGAAAHPTYVPIAARLSVLDWSKVDIITIAYGTNDWSADAPIGTDADADGTTWKGAINYMVDQILSAYPHIQIYFIGPMYRNVGGIADSDTNPNGNSDFLVDFSDALIERCVDLKLPVLDFYHTSGINTYNIAALSSDGLHPTTIKAQRIVAQKWAGFLRSAGA